jgi:uncharacterized protein involved in exopolysaccharide biosynthesis
MTAAAADTEREVDLARWWAAVVALWWLPVAGLVLGAIIGVLYSLTGGGTYKATALISLGQPTSPGGVVVASFGTNPRAVSEIVSGAAFQRQAEDRADLRPGALRGHVSVAQVGTAATGTAVRTAPLISLAVTGSHPKNTAAAANVLASIVVQQTTAAYVGTKIHAFKTTLASVDAQLASVKTRIAVIQKAVASAKNLDPLQQLVIVSQDDNAETHLGNLTAQQQTLQEQLAFAEQVESAKVVERGASVKVSAHSRKASLAIGAVIGLLIGAIVAIAGESRLRRSRA